MMYISSSTMGRHGLTVASPKPAAAQRAPRTQHHLSQQAAVIPLPDELSEEA